MKATSLTLGAAGASAWIPLDSKRNPFSVALAGAVTSGGTLTYKVQHTLDNVQCAVPCSITRSTTTATLTLADHGVTGTSDSITVQGAGAPFDGTFAVAGITDANVITYTVLNSGLTASGQGAKVAVARVFDHSSLTGKTANADGNYAYPVSAIRLNVTAYTSGKVTLTAIQS